MKILTNSFKIKISYHNKSSHDIYAKSLLFQTIVLHSKIKNKR